MMRKLARRLRETDDLLRSSTFSREAALSISREMPKMNAQAPTEAPEKLIHAPSGMEFPLSTTSETTIGRKDAVTGIYPDVDLSPIDTQRSISRRHAKIFRRGSKFFVGEEIGTMNSTFVNGTRLETGVPAEIRAGDEVRFGVISLKFVVP
jgi:pSer/pThr/pTyr-binding forkhead associated (FHA) protein